MSSARGTAHQVEVWLFALLLFFLPILEAPKNIFWLLWLLAWVFNRARSGDWGGRFDYWDALILAWIASGYVVAAFAGFHKSEWGAPADLVRNGLVVLALRRAGYGEREWKLFMAMLMAGVGVGLVVAWHVFFIQARRMYFELHSVGHVNHTAIYLAILFGAAIGAQCAYGRRMGNPWRMLLLLSTILIGAAVIITESRGIVVVAAALAVGLGIAFWPRTRLPLAVLGAVVAVTIITAFAARIEVVQKIEKRFEENYVLSSRDAMWNTALEGWRHYPVFGVGMDNMHMLTKERLQAWAREEGREFDVKRYAYTPHAHNLYINTLVERGVFGLAVLLALLGAWAWDLLRLRPRASDPDVAWATWAGAASGWFVSVSSGLFNTSLHHEHAMLSLALLGFWLGWRRAPSQAPSADEASVPRPVPAPPGA
jgi:O-antigen ligase